MDKSYIELDLDALAPKAVNIKYKDKTIEVNPLSLENYAKLVSLSSDMAKLTENSEPSVVMSLYARIKELINECIPDFAGVDLNQIQLTAVLNLLVQMNTPKDKAVEELKKQGISLNAGGKRDPKA